MTIKDYKCKCGHNDFFFADKGNQKGIYCSFCGKWLKWADKDEQNLRMNEDELYNVVIMIMKHIRPDGQFSYFSYSEVNYIYDLLNKIKAEGEVKPLANGDWQYGNESSTVSYSDRTESEKT